MRGAWRRALAWERGDSCTDPANLLGIHLPCTPLATCDLLGFADALCSALTACNFFLGRQEKVTKKKATPRYAAGFAGCPALLARPGDCATRGCAPQTVLAEIPRRSCVARHLSRGPVNHPWLRGCQGEFDFCPFFAVDRNRSFFRELFQPSRLSDPHVKRRATQARRGTSASTV